MRDNQRKSKVKQSKEFMGEKKHTNMMNVLLKSDECQEIFILFRISFVLDYFIS